MVYNLKERIASQLGIEDASHMSLQINGKKFNDSEKMKYLTNGTIIDLISNEQTSQQQTPVVEPKNNNTKQAKSHKPARTLRSNCRTATKQTTVKRLEKKAMTARKNKVIRTEKSVSTSSSEMETEAIETRGRKKKPVKRIASNIAKADDNSSKKNHSDSELAIGKAKTTKSKAKKRKTQSDGSQSNTQNETPSESIAITSRGEKLAKKTVYESNTRLIDQRELLPLSSGTKDLFDDFSGYCQKNRAEMDNLLDWKD